MPRLLVFSDSTELIERIGRICESGAWEVASRTDWTPDADLAGTAAVLVDARHDAAFGEQFAWRLSQEQPFLPIIFLGPNYVTDQVGRDRYSYLHPLHLDDLQHILLSLSLSMPQEQPALRPCENAVPRILIVDDNLQLATLIERALRSLERFDVRVATSGYEAVSMLPSFRPNVAVIDLALGDMDGRTVCEYIRSHERLLHTRIIAISGYLSEDRLHKEPCPVPYDCFLEKPFKVKDIVDKILPLLRDSA